MCRSVWWNPGFKQRLMTSDEALLTYVDAFSKHRDEAYVFPNEPIVYFVYLFYTINFWFFVTCLADTSFLSFPFFFFKEFDLGCSPRPRGGEEGLAIVTGIEVFFFYRVLATSLKRQAKCVYVHMDSIYVRGFMCTCVLSAPILVTHLETYHLQPPRPD